ncbi:glycosyltransferase family 2 protein [Eisenibacter elegans]|jgi:rhamnosyltransferase|uniref:glycosyltransferase family 2 protein n=1 Tax=Eisenibacter elegans TaxID=997 RepID=UPI000429D540|nr:glycosyltransferase family A protein [Eisenibacter elegans]
MQATPKVSVVIPTYNAMAHLPELYTALKAQTLDYELFVIDSASTDGTQAFLTKNQINHHVIAAGTFNHGGTRNEALNHTTGDLIIYLTQDALPANSEAFMYLTQALLQNDNVGIAYGRQLPYPDADPFGAFTRIFNYPQTSQLKTLQDADRLGVKACFLSNSFAAYKRELLLKLGGFPTNVIISEDAYVGAKALINGYSIAYVAEAEVYHSHNYSINQEFKRYFDIGAFYQHERELMKPFSKAGGEGLRFVIKQCRYLIETKKYHYLPEWFVRNIAKFIAFKLGAWEAYLPIGWKKKLSMHAFFWK